MQLKYIIVMNRGCETPIIFPEWMHHAEAAGGRTCIAAGFVRFIGTNEKLNTIIVSNKVQVKCWGESKGVSAVSRGKEDALLIEAMLESSLN